MGEMQILSSSLDKFRLHISVNLSIGCIQNSNHVVLQEVTGGRIFPRVTREKGIKSSGWWGFARILWLRNKIAETSISYVSDICDTCEWKVYAVWLRLEFEKSVTRDLDWLLCRVKCGGEWSESGGRVTLATRCYCCRRNKTTQIWYFY